GAGVGGGARTVSDGRREHRVWVRADARRTEPLEPVEGHVVGAAAARAGVPGDVRLSAGAAVPARRDVPALAPRQASARVHVRPARSDGAVRTEAGVRIAVAVLR